MGVCDQRHALAALYPQGKDPLGTEGWLGLRVGLDTEVRGKILLPLPGIEPRSSGRPVRSQTLYCLSYTIVERNVLGKATRRQADGVQFGRNM
jgi:hypothetical protein